MLDNLSSLKKQRCSLRHTVGHTQGMLLSRRAEASDRHTFTGSCVQQGTPGTSINSKRSQISLTFNIWNCLVFCFYGSCISITPSVAFSMEKFQNIHGKIEGAFNIVGNTFPEHTGVDTMPSLASGMLLFSRKNIKDHICISYANTKSQIGFASFLNLCFVKKRKLVLTECRSPF